MTNHLDMSARDNPYMFRSLCVKLTERRGQSIKERVRRIVARYDQCLRPDIIGFETTKVAVLGLISQNAGFWNTSTHHQVENILLQKVSRRKDNPTKAF